MDRHKGMTGRMFSGRHDHALDEKGRTMIPKEFRAYLELLGQKAVVVTYLPGKPGCLEVRTPASFQAYQRAFSRAKKPAVLERFAIVYFGGALQVDIDRTGRVLLPPNLRSRIGLSDRVAFVGIDGTRFQIWRPEDLDDVYAFCDDHINEIHDALSESLADIQDG